MSLPGHAQSWAMIPIGFLLCWAVNVFTRSVKNIFRSPRARFCGIMSSIEPESKTVGLMSLADKDSSALNPKELSRC